YNVFFQAEDGIRDRNVTGVQTCALPICSPRFRTSASVCVQKVAFATGILPNIYAFHRYTRNSTFLSTTQVNQFRMLYGVEPQPFTLDLINRQIGRAHV